MDTSVPLEEAQKVAALFPASSFVSVAEAGHETASYTQCARDLMAHFIETLDLGDTSCASGVETVYPAVGRFPLLAKDARPARSATSGNQIGIPERKVLTVAIAALLHVLKRIIVNNFSGDGPCLRAGGFHVEFGESGIKVALNGCAFAEDVVVSGTILANFDSTLTADLFVSGPGTRDGSLHVDGNFLAPGAVGDFKVSGDLGGHQVAVLVPEA